ncbi:MAG: helix-turn-helix transcriptional regulator [Ruminococcaceae bacterium]|jgi:DNA-binding XRE family transcriptional regulator|nr:helix-turn-helix transcriptional regulator [Oscillospiraceae bacterium]
MVKTCEIRGARARLGLTQQYMAEQLGISPASYSNKEQGKTQFADAEKFKVAKIFDWSLSEINDFLFDGQLPIGNTEMK